jgi:uncharacterized damage-inducible protein DinB
MEKCNAMIPGMSPASIRFLGAGSVLALLALAQNIPPGAGQGWLGEFNHAARQCNALAEATPADKFTWRPAAGIRSVAEVYMHIAVGNYMLLTRAGVSLPPEAASRVKPEVEKSATAKADVLRILKHSQDLVREHYPKADLKQKTKFFGAETTIEGVYLRILVHNHEHMGQSIAYARSIGVVPPWSQ